MNPKASLILVVTARRRLVSLLVAALSFGAALAAETNSPTGADTLSARPSLRDGRIHDPSTIVKGNGEYWLFATGMGIISRHSKDLVNWTNGPRAFPSAPAWT